MADTVDWDAIAADVLANFEATGQWFATGAPPPPPSVDWNALAAQVLANFEETGQWFVGEIPKPPPTPSATSYYILFSQHSAPPGTRDQWQPQELVGDTDGTIQGLVDGHSAVVPLSAFDAFNGTEHVDTTWSIFGYASDAAGPDGTQLSNLLLQQLAATAEPGSFQTGAVLDGPAGTPENPYVMVSESAESLFTVTTIGMADADWGGIQNIELLERQPPSLDSINVRNFEDVRLKFIPTEAHNTGALASISDAKRGEVDASAAPGTLLLLLGLTSDGPQGDNTFTVKGTAQGDDFIAITPGGWGAGGTTETRLDHLTNLVNDGSDSLVNVTLSAGHSVLDASRTHAVMDVSGGPDSAGSSITPAFSVALAEPGQPGTAIFGGQVIRADLFYPGLTLGESVPVTVTTEAGPVAATGHTVLQTRPGASTPEVALEIDPHVSFTAVAVDGANPPDLIPTGTGGLIANANFTLPSVTGLPPGSIGSGVATHGDGALIVASQGADTMHYRPSTEGALAIEGFDPTMDHIVLDGASASNVRIYDFTQNPNTPQSHAATLIVFQDLVPGTALHSMIYLPGVTGLSLGHEVLIG